MPRNSVLVNPDCEAIKRRRKALGMTAQAAAESAGISIATWSFAERCKPISDLSEAKILHALDRLESEMAQPSQSRSDDLRAVLQEQREIRRLVESLIAQLRSE